MEIQQQITLQNYCPHMFSDRWGAVCGGVVLTVTGPQGLTMNYDANGNILTKSDVGTNTFEYNHPTKPYALTDLETASGLVPEDLQVATYTSFEQVSTIDEGDYHATFTYNADDQRAKMLVTDLGSPVLTRWYVGSRYIKETEGAVTKEFTWVGGDAYSAPAVAVKQGANTTWYYLLRDYLGNITHVVNTSNTVTAEYSYDAWGRRRDPDDWGSYDVSGEPELFAGRGFTGHEWLPWVNLYNMNGRLYDPVVGRFLSADNYVQMPGFSQSFNRYSYALNNPLKFTDPDGEFIFTALCAIIPGAQVLLPIAIGADIGAITGGIRGANSDVGFWGGAWRGAAVGAVGGALSMVGGGTFVANVAWGMGEGALTGGLDAALWGNEIGNGMLYGAAIGGAFAFGQSTIESVKNMEAGYGFGTDVGRFNHYAKGVQEAFENSNMSDLQSNLGILNNIGESRFGTNPNVQFIASGSSKTMPDGQLGVSFFQRNQAGNFIRRTGNSIRRSYVHESAHVSNIITTGVKYNASTNKMVAEKGFYKGNRLLVPNGRGQMINHGTVGYYDAIRLSGKYHLKAVESLYPGTGIAWKSYGFMKYIHLIPLRY
ncbi:MAG: RHS repeat domain-containing protein [Mariniphaga sp.]